MAWCTTGSVALSITYSEILTSVVVYLAEQYTTAIVLLLCLIVFVASPCKSIPKANTAPNSHAQQSGFPSQLVATDYATVNRGLVSTVQVKELLNSHFPLKEQLINSILSCDPIEMQRKKEAQNAERWYFNFSSFLKKYELHEHQQNLRTILENNYGKDEHSTSYLQGDNISLWDFHARFFMMFGPEQGLNERVSCIRNVQLTTQIHVFYKTFGYVVLCVLIFFKKKLF